MNLSGTVVGGKVTCFKNLRPTGEETGRDVLFFGLAHRNYPEYDVLAAGTDRSYVPNWIGALVADSANIARTAVVLELPPFDPPAMLASGDIVSGQVTSDPIITQTLTKIRGPLGPGGAATTNGWSLLGTDLRYKFTWDGGQFVNHHGAYRYSIHNVDYVYNDTMSAELTWTQSFIEHYDYYWYLIGQTSETGGFDRMVEAVVTRADSDRTPRAKKREIFAAGAALCRRLCEGVPLDLKRKIVYHLSKVEVGRVDDAPNPTVRDAVKYAVAEQFINLGLLLYIFSPTIAAKNMVVVIGHDHVETVKRFVAANTTDVTHDGLIEGVHAGGAMAYVRSTLGGVIQIT